MDLLQQFQINQLNQKIDREVDRAEDGAVDSAARSISDLEERVSARLADALRRVPASDQVVFMHSVPEPNLTNGGGSVTVEIGIVATV